MTAARRSVGTLFVVATPVGNLADLTARAVTTLRDTGRILAEDTRRTRALLRHLGFGGKTVERCDAHASTANLERVVARLIDGEDAALVTDAGTPAVSDPGAMLVAAAVRAGVRVVPIPGASALLAALAASGFTGAFRFVGFLPRSGAGRREALALVASTTETVVLFESPTRLPETLAELAARQPERAGVVARELTKLHEELVRGTLTDLAALKPAWRGEITLVLGPIRAVFTTVVTDEQQNQWIDELLTEGLAAKTVADIVAARAGLGRRDVYARVVMRKNASSD